MTDNITEIQYVVSAAIKAAAPLKECAFGRLFDHLLVSAAIKAAAPLKDWGQKQAGCLGPGFRSHQSCGPIEGHPIGNSRAGVTEFPQPSKLRPH